MDDVRFAARDRRLEALFMNGACAKTERVLVARPKGFFSLRQGLTVEEQDENGTSVHAASPGGRGSYLHATCVLLFVGVSALLGWLTT